MKPNYVRLSSLYLKQITPMSGQLSREYRVALISVAISSSKYIQVLVKFKICFSKNNICNVIACVPIISFCDR